MLRKEQIQVKMMKNGEKQSLPHLEIMEKIHEIPVMESAVDVVGKFYNKLKRSNSVAEWTFNAAELGVSTVANKLTPTLVVPIHLADTTLCRSIQFMEDNVPAVMLPPQQLLENVYTALRDSKDKITKPVIHRATSVREIATKRVHDAYDFGINKANLAFQTKVGLVAADGLDKGLILAEQMLDNYFPPQDEIDGELYQENAQDFDENNRALQTVHRVSRLTQALQYRVKSRTMAQVKSLGEHSMDAIHYLLTITYMAITDPRTSATNVAQIWQELSNDEPENQAAPETIEERAILLVREFARRVIHTLNSVAAVPTNFLTKYWEMLQVLGPMSENMKIQARFEQLQATLSQLISYMDQYLLQEGKADKEKEVGEKQTQPVVAPTQIDDRKMQQVKKKISIPKPLTV